MANRRGYCGTHCGQVIGWTTAFEGQVDGYNRLGESTVDSGKEGEQEPQRIDVPAYCSGLAVMWDEKGIGWCEDHQKEDE